MFRNHLPEELAITYIFDDLVNVILIYKKDENDDIIIEMLAITTCLNDRK